VCTRGTTALTYLSFCFLSRRVRRVNPRKLCERAGILIPVPARQSLANELPEVLVSATARRNPDQRSLLVSISPWYQARPNGLFGIWITKKSKSVLGGQTPDRDVHDFDRTDGFDFYWPWAFFRKKPGNREYTRPAFGNNEVKSYEDSVSRSIVSAQGSSAFRQHVRVHQAEFLFRCIRDTCLSERTQLKPLCLSLPVLIN
jgi:hypothetical protein